MFTFLHFYSVYKYKCVENGRAKQSIDCKFDKYATWEHICHIDVMLIESERFKLNFTFIGFVPMPDIAFFVFLIIYNIKHSWHTELYLIFYFISVMLVFLLHNIIIGLSKTFLINKSSFEKNGF